MDTTVKTKHEIEQERIAERSAELKEKFKTALRSVCTQYARENDMLDYEDVERSELIARRAVAYINRHYKINVLHLHYHQAVFHDAMDEFFNR